MALKKSDLIPVRQRTYLAKDFNSFRAQLLEYAQLYYPDKIKDFSEASMGGLFLDMAAYIGDNMSFYLDHQYGELNYDTAVETINIQKHLDTAGVPITGAAPATVPVTIYIEVPATTNSNSPGPREDCLPIVRQGTIFSSQTIRFFLMEDVDFSKKRPDGTYYATQKNGSINSNGKISSYIMSYSGMCISGKEETENFTIGSTFVPYRRITLSNPNVTEVIDVSDSYGNTYYKVNSLSHDVVYKNVVNTSSDNDLAPQSIKLIPAPYRFITNTSLDSRKTTLTFGAGNADTLEDDIIPDPSEFAISFPYTKTFSRISVNPEKLLQTTTLGVASTNTTLTITYRHGGGLNHNVPANSIDTIKTLELDFPKNPPIILANSVRNSIQVSNLIPAMGGEDAPTIDTLRELIPSIKNSQERIVTKEDLLARVYTIPSNFGRVFRAAVRSNPDNPLSTQLFIASRNFDQTLLTTSSDTLKKNLVKYLEPYRLISDSIDVLDAKVINLTLEFNVMIDPSLNTNLIIAQVLVRLQDFFNIRNFHIDQPIITSEVVNTIFNVKGIMSIDCDNLKFKNVMGTVNNRTYSDNEFDVESNTVKGIIIPPPGGIFEIRYPEVDIIGKAI